MEKLIIITGTPGTGKSTLAKYLGEKAGAEVVGANEIANGYGYVIGKDGYGTSIIDMKKLEKKVNQIAREHSRKKLPLILEGHLLSWQKNKIKELIPGSPLRMYLWGMPFHYAPLPAILPPLLYSCLPYRPFNALCILKYLLRQLLCAYRKVCSYPLPCSLSYYL